MHEQGIWVLYPPSAPTPRCEARLRGNVVVHEPVDADGHCTPDVTEGGAVQLTTQLLQLSLRGGGRQGGGQLT